jgi:hypothetical protein
VEDPWDRAFKTVWRINGVLILMISSLVALGLGFLLFEATAEIFDPKPPPALLEVAGTDLESEQLQLGDFEVVAGTRYLVASLSRRSDARTIESRSYGWSQDARNLLFFDSVSRRAHWLFPNHDQVIHSRSFVFDPPERRRVDETKESVVIGLLLEVGNLNVPSDARSPRRISIAAADGSGRVELISDADRLLGSHHLALDKLLVFYAERGAAHAMELDPVNRSVRFDTELRSTP